MKQKDFYKIKGQKHKAREEIKVCNDRINKIKADPASEESKRNLLREAKKDKARVVDRLWELEHKVLKKNNRRCTDHAIVRYFSRVLGMNIIELEQSIVDDERAQKVVTNGMIVTIQIQGGDR